MFDLIQCSLRWYMIVLESILFNFRCGHFVLRYCTRRFSDSKLYPNAFGMFLF